MTEDQNQDQNQLAVGQSSAKQNLATKPEKFEPTQGMLKWFDAAVELGYTASITETAQKAGLNRNNWYQWLEKPGFVEWWDTQWQKHLSLNRWKLDAIGMKQAERNYDYWHDMMERTGNLQPANQPASATQINVNLGSATSDLRRERGLEVSDEEK